MSYNALYLPATKENNPSKYGFETEKDAWKWIEENGTCKPNCNLCLAEWMVENEN